MNQFMTPGLYAEMPEIVETAISSANQNARPHDRSMIGQLQDHYGYAQRRKARTPEPIVIPSAANK